MSTATRTPRPTDHQGQCPARTARGMRTPTGDYMTCASGHTAGDPHGAPFGTGGWFTWADGTDDAHLPLPLLRAVTRYESATARYDDLVARPASTLSPAEFDALADAQQTVAESFATLADAGRLDLIAPAETAARYRQASSHCAELAARDDIDGCWDAQDEMRMCHCQLAAAGRLDLIEADDHGKTKPPLPTRPRGPHPYPTGAVT